MKAFAVLMIMLAVITWYAVLQRNFRTHVDEDRQSQEFIMVAGDIREAVNSLGAYGAEARGLPKQDGVANTLPLFFKELIAIAKSTSSNGTNAKYANCDSTINDSYPFVIDASCFPKVQDEYKISPSDFIQNGSAVNTNEVTNLTVHFATSDNIKMLASPHSRGLLNKYYVVVVDAQTYLLYSPDTYIHANKTKNNISRSFVITSVYEKDNKPVVTIDGNDIDFLEFPGDNENSPTPGMIVVLLKQNNDLSYELVDGSPVYYRVGNNTQQNEAMDNSQLQE